MATSKEPRVFTLEGANALIPRLAMVVAEQMLRRAEIETRLKELGELTGQPTDVLKLEPGDPPPVASLKRDLVGRVQEYQRGWNAVEELGAVLKDPRIGLVDFYGRVDGKLVWLCWKYGEREITHYHGLDEGFAARKEIHAAMKARHLN